MAGKKSTGKAATAPREPGVGVGPDIESLDDDENSPGGVLVRRNRLPRCAFAFFFLLGLAMPLRAALPPASPAMDEWFEQFKLSASDEELYRFLYAMPKGGDLHNHLSGAIRSEWFYDLALAQAKRGYRFYTKVRIDNCRPYGSNAFGFTPYHLLFVNIQQSRYETLSDCERGEFVALEDLNAQQKAGWLNSLRLDKPYEGRDEFFQTHWQRMGDLYANPYLTADALVLNMQKFAGEGLAYLECMIGVLGFIEPDGSVMDPDRVVEIYRQRLADEDARATGVEVRFQVTVLRFAPNAEDTLRELYALVFRHRDLFVAVNFVGREDDDKGYPARFLATLRELRRQYHGVHLSIHAGEVDEPNFHVRDTLLLGADRIGHGVNLITDADTMRLMRHGPYLVEINLVSNLLLGYVDDYSQHPFPEYLRTGIPVALSTDDRGMWDSNITDEFFVAVKEFNLSWGELVTLSRNSLLHAFAPERVRARLLEDLKRRLDAFAGQVSAAPTTVLANDAESYGFTCRQYALCSW